MGILRRNWYRFWLWTGFYQSKPERRVSLAKQDKKLASIIFGTLRHCKNIAKASQIDIILQYAEDNALVAEIGKKLYPGVLNSKDNALVAFAVADFDFAKAIIQQHDLFKKFTPIDRARVINHYQYSEDFKQLCGLCIDFTPTFREEIKDYLFAQVQNKQADIASVSDAQRLLMETNILLATCNTVEKKQLITRSMADEVSVSPNLPGVLFDLGSETLNLMLHILQQKKCLIVLGAERLLNLICHHGKTEKNVRDINAGLQTNGLSIGSLVQGNPVFVYKLLKTKIKYLANQVPVEDRYRAFLNQSIEALQDYLPDILFDPYVEGSATQEMQPSMVNLNQQLLSRLNNTQLFTVITKNQSPLFIKSLAYCLEKTGHSLERRIISDKEFAGNIFRLGNKEILLAVGSPTEMALFRGEGFVNEHFDILLDVAQSNRDEAEILLNSQIFIDLLKIKLHCEPKESCLGLCKKLSYILNFRQTELGHAVQRYRETHSLVCGYLKLYAIRDASVSNEVLTNNDLKALFTSQELFDHFKARPQPKTAPGSDGDAAVYARQAQQQETLEARINEAKNSTDVAVSLLSSQQVLDVVVIVEIIIARISDAQFANQLENNKLGPKNNPINIIKLAQSNKEAAIAILKNPTLAGYFKEEEGLMIQKRFSIGKHYVLDSALKPHYQALNLAFDSDTFDLSKAVEVVKAAARPLLRAAHSDKGAVTSSTENLKKIKDASSSLVTIFQENQAIIASMTSYKHDIPKTQTKEQGQPKADVEPKKEPESQLHVEPKSAQGSKKSWGKWVASFFTSDNPKTSREESPRPKP